MRFKIRNIATSWAIFFLFISCYAPRDSRVQKSLDHFEPYTPSTNVNAVGTASVSKLAVGLQHTCVLRTGSVYCWGLNDNGQIGNADGGFTENMTDPFSGESPAPKVVLKPFLVLKGAQDLSVGYEHTCAVKDKTLFCWGSNTRGQLGLDAKSNASTPTEVPIGVPIAQVRSRGYFTCALSESGKLFCFGSRMVKKSAEEPEPVLVSKTPIAVLNDGVTSFSLSTSHLCAVQNGDAKCLGYNAWGEIADPARMNQDIPSFFSSLSSGVSQVTATDARTCVIQSGKMLCFGRTLGDRAVDNSPSAKWQIPDPIPTEAVFWNGVAPGNKISASAAVLSSLSELFYGSYFHNQGVPKKIALQIHDFDFSEKDENGCMLFKNLEVRCWGSNIFGQFGNGERSVSQSAITQAISVKF